MIPPRHRPRCPRCGAKVTLVIAYCPPPARVEDGPVVLSSLCGYYVRHRGLCRQPVVLVLDGSRVEYAFPPSFEAIHGLTPAAILERWSAARVWSQHGEA